MNIEDMLELVLNNNMNNLLSKYLSISFLFVFVDNNSNFFDRLFDTDLVNITEQSPNFLQPFRKSSIIGIETTDV